MPAWVLPTLLTAGGMVANYFSARSANKFSERMSSTAHQREVKDMMAAGINPMMSGRGSGASSPQGENPQLGEGGIRGASSALAVQQQRAQIALLEAQADNTREDAALKATQRGGIQMEWNAGRFELLKNQMLSGRLSLKQQQQLLPHLLAKAKEEVGLTANSAAAVKARAALDELARSGALNEAELQDLLRQGGPWMKLVGRLLLQMRR